MAAVGGGAGGRDGRVDSSMMELEILRPMPLRKIEAKKLKAAIPQANTLLALQRYEEALPVLQEILRLREMKLGTIHYVVAEDMMKIGQCLHRLSRHPEAKNVLMNCLTILEELQPDGSETANVCSLLSSVSMALGRFHIAVSFGLRAARSWENIGITRYFNKYANQIMSLSQIHVQHGKADRAMTILIQGFSEMEKIMRKEQLRRAGLLFDAAVRKNVAVGAVGKRSGVPVGGSVGAKKVTTDESKTTFQSDNDLWNNNDDENDDDGPETALWDNNDEPQFPSLFAAQQEQLSNFSSAPTAAGGGLLPSLNQKMPTAAVSRPPRSLYGHLYANPSNRKSVGDISAAAVAAVGGGGGSDLIFGAANSASDNKNNIKKVEKKVWKLGSGAAPLPGGKNNNNSNSDSNNGEIANKVEAPAAAAAAPVVERKIRVKSMRGLEENGGEGAGRESPAAVLRRRRREFEEATSIAATGLTETPVLPIVKADMSGGIPVGGASVVVAPSPPAGGGGEGEGVVDINASNAALSEVDGMTLKMQTMRIGTSLLSLLDTEMQKMAKESLFEEAVKLVKEKWRVQSRMYGEEADSSSQTTWSTRGGHQILQFMDKAIRHELQKATAAQKEYELSVAAANSNNNNSP